MTPPLAEKERAAATEGDRAVVAGTRPEGTRDEREAGARVREMFSEIAPRYDFLNHFLSLSRDRVWRRRTAKRFAHILARPGARVLDLCCGTGDLAFALERMAGIAQAPGESGQHAQIFGSDFALPMLARALEKADAAHSGVGFLASDALSLPFAAASFDLVTSAFGFRNLANYERGLREIARVLRPSGEVGILEFSDPQEGIGAAGFRFYFRHILPRIGGAISGNRDAYAYLPSSVTRFPPPQQLAAWMDNAGFENVRCELWKFGSVALHTGTKRR